MRRIVVMVTALVVIFSVFATSQVVMAQSFICDGKQWYSNMEFNGDAVKIYTWQYEILPVHRTQTRISEFKNWDTATHKLIFTDMPGSGFFTTTNDYEMTYVLESNRMRIIQGEAWSNGHRKYATWTRNLDCVVK